MVPVVIAKVLRAGMLHVRLGYDTENPHRTEHAHGHVLHIIHCMKNDCPYCVDIRPVIHDTKLVAAAYPNPQCSRADFKSSSATTAQFSSQPHRGPHKAPSAPHRSAPLPLAVAKAASYTSSWPLGDKQDHP